MRDKRLLASLICSLFVAGPALAQNGEATPRVYAPSIVAAQAEWTICVEGDDGKPLAGEKLTATVGAADATHEIEVVADEKGAVKMPKVSGDDCVQWLKLARLGKTFFRRPVTVLPPPPAAPPTIGWTPETFSPAGSTTAIGTGVDGLKNWELIPEGGGTPIGVTPVAGSPYEQVLRTPPNVPDVPYHVQARDAGGNVVQCSDTISPVAITLKGERTVREGTGGTLVVSATKDTWVHLEAAPGIQLATNDCYVREKSPARVRFKAPVRGQFTVRAEARTAPQGGRYVGEPPEATVALVGDPEVSYDPATDTTTVRQQVKLDVPKRGPKLKGAEVVVAGASWGERPAIDVEIVQLDLKGSGIAILELPGQVSPESIGTHILDLGIPSAPELGLPEILETEGDKIGRQAPPGGADVKRGELAPLGDLQAYSEDELAGLQVKLTYVGVQRKTVPTVAFTSYRNVLDMSKFASFRRAGIHYRNDDVAVWNFTTTTADLAAVLKAAGNSRAVAKPKSVDDPTVSLMLCVSVGDQEKGFEALLAPQDAKKVATAIRDAISERNALAREILGNWIEIACP